MAVFRLTRLLALRGQLRRLRRLEAQHVEEERDALTAQRAGLRAVRGDALDAAARAIGSGSADGASLQLAASYDAALRERLAALEERLTDNRQRLAAKRDELGRERREERKLEHLAARHRTAIEAEAARAAENLLDELVLARHLRERREDGRGG